MKILGLPYDLHFVDDEFFEVFLDWTLPTRLFSQMAFNWQHYYYKLGIDFFGYPE